MLADASMPSTLCKMRHIPRQYDDRAWDLGWGAGTMVGVPRQNDYGAITLREARLTMTQAGGSTPRQPVRHNDVERGQIERFIKALNQAMVLNGLSQRGLCERLGIQVGTLTKYLRGEVAPLKVGTGIQSALADALGVTLDALISYYQEGEYITGVSLQAVESWIRSDAGQEDLPTLMASLQAAGQRWIGKGPPDAEEEPFKQLEPYTWPLQELEDAGVSEKFRERLGLTKERMAALVERGEYDDDLVEAFSVACNYELEAVSEAFAQRTPIS